MDYECPYCGFDMCLETDGFEVLDGECEQCGEDIHSDALDQRLNDLIGQAESLADIAKGH